MYRLRGVSRNSLPLSTIIYLYVANLLDTQVLRHPRLLCVSLRSEYTHFTVARVFVSSAYSIEKLFTVIRFVFVFLFPFSPYLVCLVFPFFFFDSTCDSVFFPRIFVRLELRQVFKHYTFPSMLYAR